MRFGYTIVYVDDVRGTLDFYERAFGLTRGHVDEHGNYAELATGTTRLAFVSQSQARELVTGGYTPVVPSEQPPGIEVAFVVEDDLDAAYRRALDAGAVAVAPPDDKPWGQRIAYVRDINGVLVELVAPTEA